MKHDCSSRVLGLHPSQRGFGWILFEAPLVPFDWGTADARNNKNAQALLRFENLLDKYRPGVLVLEAFEDEKSRRGPRIRRLCRALIKRAEARDIQIRVYTRLQIRTAFESTGAKTREEIAAVIAEHIAVLRPRLPEPRKIWVGEHPNMALFGAAACAAALFALGGA